MQDLSPALGVEMNRRSLFGALFGGGLSVFGVKSEPRAIMMRGEALKTAALNVTIPQAMMNNAVNTALSKVRFALPDGCFQIPFGYPLTEEDDDCTIAASSG